MISRLTLKRLLMFFSALTLYFIYFNARFNRKFRRRVSSSFDSTKYEVYIENDLDPIITQAIKNYRAKRNIDIKYSNRNPFIENSVILMKKYNLNVVNFNEERLLDICEEGEQCETCDLRAFIYAYFKEATHNNGMFQSYSKVDDTYLLQEDSKVILKEANEDEAMKALGLMLSLALVTETFLDLTFSLIFLAQNCVNKYKHLLDVELYWYDYEQYEIYCPIKHGYRERRLFGYDPNSSKPFRGPDKVANTDTQLYNVQDYPVKLAAERMFHVSFQKSTELINEITEKFFGKSIVHFDDRPNKNYKEQIVTNQIGVQFYTMFSAKQGVFDAVQWRDNSIYDSSTRMFWKALNNFDREKQLKIFLKITGLNGLPAVGFKRLPKTRFKAHPESEIKFVPSRFEIWVPAYSTLEQMQALLNKYI